MRSNFKQLTAADRVAIVHLTKAGISKIKIAQQLGVHRSTIYRELARNSSGIGYLPLIAERRVSLIVNWGKLGGFTKVLRKGLLKN